MGLDRAGLRRRHRRRVPGPARADLGGATHGHRSGRDPGLRRRAHRRRRPASTSVPADDGQPAAPHRVGCHERRLAHHARHAGGMWLGLPRACCGSTAIWRCVTSSTSASSASWGSPGPSAGRTSACVRHIGRQQPRRRLGRHVTGARPVERGSDGDPRDLESAPERRRGEHGPANLAGGDLWVATTGALHRIEVDRWSFEPSLTDAVTAISAGGQGAPRSYSSEPLAASRSHGELRPRRARGDRHARRAERADHRHQPGARRRHRFRRRRDRGHRLENGADPTGLADMVTDASRRSRWSTTRSMSPRRAGFSRPP